MVRFTTKLIAQGFGKAIRIKKNLIDYEVLTLTIPIKATITQGTNKAVVTAFAIKQGNSYSLLLPKDLIECEVINPNEDVLVVLEQPKELEKYRVEGRSGVGSDEDGGSQTPTQLLANGFTPWFKSYV